MDDVVNHRAACHQLRYRSLLKHGIDMAFPCDATGAVDMDRLDSESLNNYLYARAGIGREFAPPVVVSIRVLAPVMVASL
jgi:hypothetical protein